ncbi:hypothetical protein AAVH_08477 [Aphelenchoides avenae]|nr:hypothetical protein AAVH_08477 [Aphelenchus avenae]
MTRCYKKTYLLILLCSAEDIPLGEPRTSYPDAEPKKTIEANLTAAKAEYPKYESGSPSMDFANNSTTPYCYVEVTFVYQEQYNFTFEEVSIDDKLLQYTCVDSVPINDKQPACMQRNSSAER